MKLLLKWEKELVMHLAHNNWLGVTLFLSKILTFIIIYA
jgi:hypothetical protein